MAGNSWHRYGMKKMRYCQSPQESPYVCIGWSDVTVICDLYAVGQHGEQGEDLLHYSNKIESVSLRICPYYQHLAKKMMPQ